MAKSAKELRAIMANIAQALRTYDGISEEQFPKAFGITKREALLNMANDDFQISGITDAQDDQTFEGYKVSDLRKAFEHLAPKPDWKGPISGWVPISDFAIANTACRFFTATELLVKEQFGECYHVEADGYRAGPCGDR